MLLKSEVDVKLQKIRLFCGSEAVVDDEYYPKVNKLSWYFHSGYAARNRPMRRKETAWPKIIFMHSIILPAPNGFVVDHINGNRLDNRRENLRLVTVQQNNFNRRSNINYCSSRYKGVFWIEERQLWRSSIKLNGKSTNLGYFRSEEDAASAYNFYAVKLFGSFARLNDAPVNEEWWKCRVFIKENSTGYRGVTEQRPGKWQARITVADKRLSLGYFDSAIDAAICYNAASIKHHGEKALLNTNMED